jgi:hypothetical protein
MLGDGGWLAETTGGDWRYFVEVGIAVAEALAAVVYGRLWDAVDRLPPATATG